MSKTINWDAISKSPVERKNVKYQSGKEMMTKSFEREQEAQEAKETMAKAFPVMNELFMIRYRNNTPLTVMRPLTFQSSVLQKGYGNAKYVDTNLTLKPGTILTLESVDTTMGEFLFKSDKDEDIAIPFTNKNNIFMNTDLYETAKLYLENEE